MVKKIGLKLVMIFKAKRWERASLKPVQSASVPFGAFRYIFQFTHIDPAADALGKTLSFFRVAAFALNWQIRATRTKSTRVKVK